MGKQNSKRAEILKRLLPQINAGNYDEYDRYFVFGASSGWDMIMDLTEQPSEREDPSLEEATQKLVSDSKLHKGRSHVAGRATLSKPPSFMTNAFESLSPEQRTVFRDILTKLLEQKSPDDRQQRTVSDSNIEDALDAAFAEEVLGKLPKVVDWALHLDEVTIDRVPNEDVKLYFEEAHRCYLYGFHVACAVLCRAILASALENLCDRKRKIRNRVPHGQSYFKALVEKAAGDGLLEDDRPEWAIKIRDAGNDAIHNLLLFRQRWSNKVDEILLNTRKVLLDLYARGT